MPPKQQIRREIGARRKELKPQWVETSSTQIVENLQSLKAFQTAKTVALYMAIAGEVNIDALFPKCRESGKHVCIPVFNSVSKIYEMAEITPETKFTRGHYGIMEPQKVALVSMKEVDLVAVPGVAFDRKGNRLGRGGGYYDRLLEGFSGISAAIAFDFQILQKIPTEQHDKPVDVLVTESEVINVS
ncbi:MAG: 5-formyltetrahydrofolate cyclo-ligase [Verrucomicrobiota bacterium]